MFHKRIAQQLTFILSLVSLLVIFPTNTLAATTLYRSAGWVGTDGSPQYSNTTGCQASNDGLYCSRINSIGNAGLFFGTFGDLEDFEIPLNSSIDKLHIRVSGKNSTTQYIAVFNAYNNLPWTNSCQTPSDLWSFNLIQERVREIHTSTAGNGLANCITATNINFRNLTFRIFSPPNPSWNADIDNFEIAFDYTPPSVTPTPVDFPENQKGTVWEIGPDKSNIKRASGLDNIISVATGKSYALTLKNDGTVWAWGSNQSGQLGNGTSGNSSEVPIQVKGPNGEGYFTDVKAIAAGNDYSLALKNDGTVWTWGNNVGKYRGLGNDAGDVLLFPTQINSAYFSDVIAIAAGYNHSLALNADGTVVGWGLNGDGQLGIGCFLYNCSLSIRPVKTQNIDNVKVIAAGDAHSFAVKNDGSVWGWGSSRTWRLGENVLNMNNTFPERPLPVQIPELQNIKSISSKGTYSLAITNDNYALEWGGEDRLKSPRQIGGITNVSKISAGTTSFSPGVLGHVIKEDKTLWQIYINDIAPRQVPVLQNVTAVASGYYTSTVAIVGMATDVLGDNTGPEPFLDLPWDYKSKGKTFDDASMAINSYFDHEYPLQSKGRKYPEPQNVLYKLKNYLGSEGNGSLLTCDEYCYSGHDGYDYGSKAAGVVGGDIVYPAAPGVAEYKYTSASGHLIYIDHLNGYQTRYYHLQDKGIFEGEAPGTKIDVVRSTPIASVGGTGSFTTGPHLHFSVFQDTDGDKDFEDEEPFGVTDPFGWYPLDPNKQDPWANYTVSQDGQVLKGNKSSYLWSTSLANNEMFIGPDGGTMTVSKAKFNFHPNTVPSTTKVKVQSSPNIKTVIDGKMFKSVGHSFNAAAYDIFGNLKDAFVGLFTLTIDFTELASHNVKPETLSIYSSKDRETWIKEETTIDYENSKATAEIDHMTYFALMGEVSDTKAPTTIAIINGSDESVDWFNDDVSLHLMSIDNENGAGVEFLLYKLLEGDWHPYTLPIVLTEIGEHKLSFYSGDKEGNIEEVKNVTFHIDKTAPVTVASVSGEEGMDGWFVSDVLVGLSATDNGEIDRIEYSLDYGVTYVSYSDPFAISKEGSSEVWYRSVDKAGNVEEAKKLVVKIDKIAPDSTVYTTGVFGSEGWYRSDVEISFNASDGGSGFDKTFYSLDGENFEEYINPLTIVNQGTTEIIYYAVDKAGNKESQKSLKIKVDKTAPEAEIKYDLSKFDVIVTGKDNFSEVTVSVDMSSKLNPKYILTDLAGNSLVITTGEIQIGKQVTQTIKSLQYNKDKTIQLDRNIFFTLVLTDKNNVVKHLDQYISMKGDKRIFTNYSPQQNITTIFTKNLGATSYTREDKSGIVLLKLSTDKGTIKYTY